MRRQTVAATLMLAGWILLRPPLEGPPMVVVEDAPIGLWEHVSAHDTAVDCENGRAEDIAALVDLYRRGVMTKDTMELNLKQRAAARCVPAEHLYPPRAPMPRGKP